MEMEKYDFDRIIDRRGTGAVKWDSLKNRYGRDDLIALWVADMDFETPGFITDALKKRLDHPIFGYTVPPASYWQSIIDWQRELHGWEIEKKWLSYIPGIVKGIGMAVNVFTRPGDKVIIQTPVYHLFQMVIDGNDRRTVYNPLRPGGNGYEMDFDHLRSLLSEGGCKMLVLCNPQNPSGMVWSPDTLRTLAGLCAEYGVLVVSDEIHSDMALYGNVHTPFATVSEAAAQNSITFGAPSKTFNIAGIVSSFAIVPNDSIRRKFYRWLHANELGDATLFATIATEAAFRYGRAWRDRLLEYLEGNIDYVVDTIEKEIPGITAMKPQASFLVWLDCRNLGLDHPGLVDLFVEQARLALNDGEIFGPGGEGFMRMNVGTPRRNLETAMERLKEAVERIRG